MNKFFSSFRWVKNVTGTIPIPTHFYKILTTCENDSDEMINQDLSRCTSLKMLTYILPHRDDEKCNMKVCLLYEQEHTFKYINPFRVTSYYQRLAKYV